MLKWAPKKQHLIGKIWDRLDCLAPQGTIGELLALDERDFVAGGLSPDEAQQSEDQFIAVRELGESHYSLRHL